MNHAQQTDRASGLSSSPAGVKSAPQSDPDEGQHFNDWPNAAAFNALEESREKIDLEISGAFPDYVAGSLYRTGPGGYKVSRSNTPNAPDFEASHWFDGFSIVHKFDLVAGGDGKCKQVWYSSRAQSDELIEHARKTGKLTGITFGQKRDPCDTLYHKLKTVWSPVLPGSARAQEIGVAFQGVLPQEERQAVKESNNSNRRLLSITSDKHVTKQIDADTLEPLGVTSQAHLHPSLKGPLSAAHPCQDPETGDMFNYNLHFGRKATYRVFQVNPQSGKVVILAEIAESDIPGAYIHSLFLTNNFVVLCVWTAHFKAYGASILWERNLLDAIAPFDAAAQVIWLVVDRRHGRGLVKKFVSPAFFAFHTVNAWEEASMTDQDNVDLFCELAQFDNLDILHHFYYKNMVSNSVNARQKSGRSFRHGGLARYKLADVPLRGVDKKKPFLQRSKPASAEQIYYIRSPKAGDLPRINPHFATRQHRYVWSVLDRGKSSFVDGLAKTDTQTQEAIVWECPKHSPGEPLFIPAPEGKGEDDGVILVVVFDGESGRSYLLCLDARTMEEMGRADVGKPVGFGFHGLHVANAS